MASKPTEINSPARRFREIILGYLEAAGCVATWPGGDALTIEDVLGSHAEAVARGEVPDWRQLLCRHPELDAELHAWMAAKDRWKFAVRRVPRRQPQTAGQANTEPQGEEGTPELFSLSVWFRKRSEP
jgi:hypothetical protein